MLAVAWALPALAGTAAAGTAAEGDLRLGDGRPVRLAGIELDDSGRAELAVLAQGELVLAPAAPPVDRWGRLRAQVRLAGGPWLQGELVRQGLAVVAPAEDVPEARLKELLALERDARAGRAGIWAGGAYGPWPAAKVAAEPWHYVLAEGRVAKVARAQGFVYLNFGRRWKEDFTLRAEEATAKRLARAGIDLMALEGRNVLARGVLFEQDGPMIEITHRDQVEVRE